MQVIPQTQGAFNAPSENTTHTTTALTHYSVTSAYTRLGLRIHTVSTRDRELAFRFLEEALEVDNEPDFASSRGIFSIQFYCSDDECQSVIAAAQGGQA